MERAPRVPVRAVHLARPQPPPGIGGQRPGRSAAPAGAGAFVLITHRAALPHPALPPQPGTDTGRPALPAPSGIPVIQHGG